MKKFFKKITAILTAVCLLSASVGFDVPGSVTARATSLEDPAPTEWNCGAAGSTITATLEDGVLVISGTGAMADYTPASKAPWDDSKASITTVIVDSGVTNIGNYAFQDCTSLTAVSLPEQMTVIGDYAFAGCTNLSTIPLPEKMTVIGDSAFRNCTALKSVMISTDVTSIENNAFYKSGLTGLHIKNGSKDLAIGTHAFAATNLITVAFPRPVTSIGKFAFHGCKKLTTVDFMNDTLPTSFGDTDECAVFGYCDKLTEIKIPCAWGTRDSWTFPGADRLQSGGDYANEIFRTGNHDEVTGEEGRDARYHWEQTCRRCGDIVKIPHTMVGTRGDGNIVFTCSDCENSETVLIDTHEHKLCKGVDDDSCGISEHNVVWEPWTNKNALPSTTGSYYLVTDVTVIDDTTIASGDTVNLCLNGHNIIKTGTRSTDTGRSYKVKGTLNLCNCQTSGTISGNRYNNNGINGGGIYVYGGTFNMYSGTISDNISDNYGGGVYVEGGTFDMYGGTISGNTAYVEGGGVYADGDTTITMHGGTISGNNSKFGGGVAIGGNDTEFMMNAGAISGNAAAGGGGVYNSYGNVRMNGGEISGNTANNGENSNAKPGGGGGVYSSEGLFEMNAGTISGNTAVNGGGVNFSISFAYRFFTMSGGEITGNAAVKGGGIYDNSKYLSFDKTVKVTDNKTGGNLYLLTTPVALNAEGSSTNTFKVDSTLNSDSVIGVSFANLPSCSQRVRMTGENIPETLLSVFSVDGDSTAYTIKRETNYTYLYRNHKLEKVESTATCAAGGVAEHYKCVYEDCGALFADPDGKNSTTTEALAVDKDPTKHSLKYDPDNGDDTITQLCDYCSHNAIVTLVMEDTTHTYTGEHIEPATFTFSGDNDWIGDDQPELTYYFNTDANVGRSDANTPTVHLTAGSYYVDKTFDIEPKSIANSTNTITISKTSYPYTGSPVKPTLKDGENTLEGTDYTITYLPDNTNVGTVNITVEGKGNYTGTFTGSFEIEYAPLTGDLSDYVNITPTDSEKVNGWYNKDITITAESGNKVGTEANDLKDSVTISDETGSTEGKKDIFIKDNNGNIYKYEFNYKLDTTAPELNSNNITSEQKTEGTKISITPTENGNAYWIVSDTAPTTAEEVKTKSAQSEQKGGTVGITSGTGNFTIPDLSAGTHKVYVVLEDSAGNLSGVVEKEITISGSGTGGTGGTGDTGDTGDTGGSGTGGGTGGSSGGGSGSGSIGGGSGGSSYRNPKIDKIELSWEEVDKRINKISNGGKLTVDMNGNKTVPSDVMKDIAKKDEVVTFVLNSEISFVVDGAKISDKVSFADLSVGESKTNLPSTNFSAIGGTAEKQFTLGRFGITAKMSLALDEDNAGKFASLMKLNSKTGKYEFLSTAKIAADGKALVDINGKGDYLMIIDTETKKPGDLNNDTINNSKDALELLKGIVYERSMNEFKSDYNGDGKTNSKDALEILKVIVGLIPDKYNKFA